MAEINKFLYGKRVGNKSIKVYEQQEGEYLVILKYYFLGFCIRKKVVTYSNYGDVEDCIIEFKSQPENIR